MTVSIGEAVIRVEEHIPEHSAMDRQPAFLTLFVLRN